MRKILVVDDQRDAAHLLVTLLKLDGYEAEQLEDDWTELARKVEDRRPDLVILDVHLSDVSGLELLRQLREHPDPTVAEVRVLLTSALDHSYEGKQAGMDGYLLKPYTRQTLLAAIEKLKAKGKA